MKYFFATLSAVFVLLLVMVGYTYVSAALPEENVAVLDEPKAHIQLITQNSNEHFWSTFKRGAQDAGVEQNVYVEFADVSAKDPGLIAEAAEQAVYSAVDGLALQAADEERTAEVLQQAERAQIPVLTFESDLFPTTDILWAGWPCKPAMGRQRR